MNNQLLKTILAIALVTTTPALADGQSVPINYDAISFFEEPLAIGLGPTTLNANALVDQAARYNTETNRDTYNTFVAGDFKLETELFNSWQIGAQYFARYNRLANDAYTDNAALFLSDEWGIIALGNVTGSVTEKIRTKRGVGNAALANNNFVGGLDDTGAFYAVTFNSYNLSFAADDQGNFESGLIFERPIGINNYKLGGRIRRGNLSETTGFGYDANSYGGTLIGEYIRGSLLYDAQIGYEFFDDNTINDTDDHIFGSLGTRYQYGAYNFSLEGGIGRFNGVNRRAFAFGSRFNLARGLSFNTGINYVFANDDDDVTTLGSLRYEL